MRSKKSALRLLCLVLFLSCGCSEVKKLLPSSIIDAAQIGMLAVDEAVKLSDDPRVICYIAVTASTILAKEAVKTIVMSQTKRLGRLVGSERSEEAATILLANYCYPALDELMPAIIDRQLYRLDPSFIGPPEPLDVDSMIFSYIERFKIEEAIEIMTGTGVLNPVPDDFGDTGPVNSATYAVARNWKDDGRIYQYRIYNGALEMKKGDSAWKPLPLPGGRSPKIIAADNNRCLVLTDDHELWWYCVRQDQAMWSIEIMRSAVELMGLKPVLGERICEEVTGRLTRLTESVAIKAASSNRQLALWRDSTGSGEYWSERCRVLVQAAMNVEPFLLRASEGKSFTAKDYAEWSSNAHREGAWSNLLSWQSRDSIFHRGKNISPDSIVDIAIGNWNGTVVTVYILASGKIWFIDEEIIQPEWKPIEFWNEQWAIFAKQYHPINNSPYPLDSSCRIDASNSVVAVSRRSGDTSLIYWLRWDYHQKDDFVYWPLDWCEHAWHYVVCPPVRTADFRISTNGTIDPRRKDAVWSVPAPYFTFHNYLPLEGYQGIFGDVSHDLVDAYPIDLFVIDTAGTGLRFSAQQAKSVSSGPVEWRRY